MKKTILVLLIGAIAGALDLIPLLMVNAPLFNMLAVMAFWLSASLFIANTSLVKNGALNGLIVSVILMLPMALAVSATNPKDFAPMMFMALLLGPIVGFVIGRFLPEAN